MERHWKQSCIIWKIIMGGNKWEQGLKSNASMTIQVFNRA